jgi:hypothetical protein
LLYLKKLKHAIRYKTQARRKSCKDALITKWFMGILVLPWPFLALMEFQDLDKKVTLGSYLLG